MLSWFSLPNLSSDQGTPLTPFPTNANTFFIQSAPLKKFIIARAISHNRARKVNHADREPSAITNNTPTIAKRRAPKSPWCGQQDSNLHALAGEPKSPESTNSTMPAYSFVPLIFTRRGIRGGAFRLILCSYASSPVMTA